jgi:hypothetical protein
MVVLCSAASAAVLASPLVPYQFDVNTTGGMLTFFLLDLLLSFGLGTVGVALNHRAARGGTIAFRRRRE